MSQFRNLLIDEPVRNFLKCFTNCVLVTLKLLRRKYAWISLSDSSLGSSMFAGNRQKLNKTEKEKNSNENVNKTLK